MGSLILVIIRVFKAIKPLHVSAQYTGSSDKINNLTHISESELVIILTIHSTIIYLTVLQSCKEVKVDAFLQYSSLRSLHNDTSKILYRSEKTPRYLAIAVDQSQRCSESRDHRVAKQTADTLNCCTGSYLVVC